MSGSPEGEGQAARVARNQSLFREVNERIEELAPASAFIEFVCECASKECTESVALTLEEYEQVRRDSSRFIVLLGHDVPGVHAVVETTDRYIVVVLLGNAASEAEQLDPRRTT